MIGRGSIMLLSLFAMAIVGSMASSAELFEARQVEVKGLKYLTAREIMEKVRFTKQNDFLRIDADSLKDALAKNPMVRTSAISRVEDKLIVNIDEREPMYVCAIVKGQETIPFEVDASYAIISVRTVHRTDVPIVVLREEDVFGGRLSSHARETLRYLAQLKREDGELYRELSQVRLILQDLYEVRFKGRKTKIIVGNKAFSTLKYLISALDEKKYYPNLLWVGSGFGVIK